MAMGHREKVRGGVEWDAFTGWRKVLSKRSGRNRWIKDHFMRRVRRQIRRALRMVDEED